MRGSHPCIKVDPLFTVLDINPLRRLRELAPQPHECLCNPKHRLKPRTVHIQKASSTYVKEVQISYIAGLVSRVLSFDSRPGWLKTSVWIPRGSSSFLSSSPTTPSWSTRSRTLTQVSKFEFRDSHRRHYAEVPAGRPSGRFLLRCRIKKPREYQLEDKDSLFYLSPDFYVGAIVNLNEHRFLLTEADDYVFAFMERDDEGERYGPLAKVSLQGPNQ